MTKHLSFKDKKKEVKLLPKMNTFCYYYLFGGEIKGNRFRLGNATMSYAKAYGLDPDDKKQYNTCSVQGLHNIRNPKIKEMMRQMLHENGLNDEVVDARLLDIIKNAQPKESIAGIREYNTLTKRINNIYQNNILVVNAQVNEKVEEALDSFLTKKVGNNG